MSGPAQLIVYSRQTRHCLVIKSDQLEDGDAGVTPTDVIRNYAQVRCQLARARPYHWRLTLEKAKMNGTP